MKKLLFLLLITSCSKDNPQPTKPDLFNFEGRWNDTATSGFIYDYQFKKDRYYMYWHYDNTMRDSGSFNEGFDTVNNHKTIIFHKEWGGSGGTNTVWYQALTSDTIKINVGNWKFFVRQK